MKNIMKNFFLTSVISLVCFCGLSCMEEIPPDIGLFRDAWMMVRCEKCRHGDENELCEFSDYSHKDGLCFHTAIANKNEHSLRALIVYFGSRSYYRCTIPSRLKIFVENRNDANKTPLAHAIETHFYNGARIIIETVIVDPAVGINDDDRALAIKFARDKNDQALLRALGVDSKSPTSSDGPVESD